MFDEKYELDQNVSPDTFNLRATSDRSIQGSSPYARQLIESKMDLARGALPDNRTEQAESFHFLYRAQSTERMELLRSLYAELEKPVNLVVMLFCEKFFPLFENWLLSCEYHQIDPRDRLLVFCLNTESAMKTKNMGIKTYFLDPQVYTRAGNSRAFGDEAFRTTVLYKNAIIVDTLKLGASVLFQDSDLIWFEDPFKYLDNENSDYDIQIMYDGPNPLYKPVYANTGFIYVRPNRVNKVLFETALRNSASILHTGSEQDPLNQIFHHFVSHNLLRLHILPHHLFLNGHLFNLEWGVSSEAMNWRRDGIVFHYSWTGNRDEKFRKLAKFGMNYLDPNQNTVPLVTSMYRNLAMTTPGINQRVFRKISRLLWRGIQWHRGNSGKLAVIVPYRDRLQHLKEFISEIRKQLISEKIEFDIFVIEQFGDGAFNRGKLKNVGFRLSQKYKWVCFHDVDLIPVKNSDYSIPDSPLQLCSTTSKWQYKPFNNSNLGGVVMFLPKHFKQINGFSNKYWGWGCEDNDLSSRCLRNGLEISKRPVVYDHLPEQQQIPSNEYYEENVKNLRNPDFAGDGLNSLSYQLIDYRETGEYFHVLVDIGSPPALRKGTQINYDDYKLGGYSLKPDYRSRNFVHAHDDRGYTDEYQNEAYAAARELIDRENGNKVFDVGCGSGYKLLKYFEDFTTVGCELSPTFEFLCAKYPDRMWVRTDFSNFYPGPIDLLLCIDVIEHLIDPDSLMRYLESINFKYIVLTTPDRDLLNTASDGPPHNLCHAREWNFDEFRQYVEKHFDVLEHRIINEEQGTQYLLCSKKESEIT